MFKQLAMHIISWIYISTRIIKYAPFIVVSVFHIFRTLECHGQLELYDPLLSILHSLAIETWPQKTNYQYSWKIPPATG